MSAPPAEARPGHDRRAGDRRKGDRRRPPRPTSDEAWLSPWGDAEAAGNAPARDASAPDLEPGNASDSRFLAREARRMVSAEGAALPRILRTYVLARAALGAALALAPWAALIAGSRPPLPLTLVSLAYASQAISLWLLHGARRDRPPPSHLTVRQWLWTIGVDLAAFLLLRLLDPAGQLNYGALLVLPLLMSGVMTRRLVALATAAGVTLVLLGGITFVGHDGSDLLVQLSQAGLAGAGLFLVTLLASELAQRLVREERSARSSLEVARQQTQLNRLVIEEMAEGVLVVDRGGRLRAINPAGRALLGAIGRRLLPPCSIADEPALAGLLRALRQAYDEGGWPDAAHEQQLPLADGERRAVQVRARFTRRSGIAADDTPPEDICVLILEDMRTVRARQSQDKLAAMGRMSAAIAHEIRNPLSAIAQANALLVEDALLPQQRQLARIVSDNVGRLARIVDDVMAVAPGAMPQASVIDARTEVARLCADWQSGAAPDLQAATRLACRLPERPVPVQFDPDHLRRVLVNLLDNAARHASSADGAMLLTLQALPSGRLARLTLASDGEPIQPDVEQHLFEPFFSTRSRGSGLGLYICRELCERHGASIEFRLAAPVERHRNLFSLMIRLAPPA